METKFNFKSQICTTVEQSQRLLSLGLKKETADMYYRFYNENTYEINPTWETIWEDRNDYKKIIPAWSLHRLIEMIKDGAIRKDGTDEDLFLDISGDELYDGTIESIEWLIKEGYFNKEYLA